MKQLCNHRSRGPLGMMYEHIKGWLVEARNKEKEEAAAAAEKNHSRKGWWQYLEGRAEERRGETPAEVSNWGRMVDLVQATFG